MARVTVIGRSGTGKSYYTGYLLERTVPNFQVAVHFDVEDEEIGLSDADHDPLYGTLRVDRNMANRLDWIKTIWNHKKIRVVPDGLTTEEMRDLYAEIAGSVMQLCQSGPCDSAFVSCDEAHNIVTQAAFPEEVERMITGGRKHGCETLHLTQRPQLLHTTVISQADLRVYFAVSDDNDLRKIDSMSNFSASILEEIPKRCCVVENKNTGNHKLLVTDPSVSVPDSLSNRIEVEVMSANRQRPHYSGDDGIVDEAFPV